MHQGKIVETGSIQEVYESPKQQYTQNLLKAIPGQKRRAA
jgi:ABC-type oligopeptide transport system ATPase subunit